MVAHPRSSHFVPLCFVLVLAVLSTPRPALAQFTAPGIGSAAPPTTLPDHLGNSQTLVPRAGSVLIVDFFATWCGPCHQALDALAHLAVARGATIQLVVIAIGETPAVVDAFFATRPLPPGTLVLFDRDGAAARAWGHNRFPTTFLVSADGVIRRINRGYGGGYPARMERWVTAMLATAQSPDGSPAR